MSFAEGRVGLRGVLSPGSPGELRLGKTAELIVGDAGLGKYFEAVRNGLVFFACTQAGVALTTTLSATATGIILSNPAGSGKNLVLLDFLAALTTAPAGVATLGWAAQFGSPTPTGVTHTTPLTVRNALLGDGSIGVGLCDSSATLPNTPVAVRPIPGGPVATGSITPPFIRDEIDGALIVKPGCSVNTFCLTTAISALLALWWAEIPEGL
jgi:hypothetical protein